ncbi:unnamed protein product [Ostreobium quekettii]|uniref:BTB domain-containing protein n=1 Tax=Ostreobium quekettii TaxID=121088 RepID=A0A8S1J7V6_9CHLO|nr:unnamed protein product [Ostreobium quekettii]|eukprot:evm.model.scf_1036.1 EVM.evm.TU.scf_1036.1   scf_1036:23641-25675(+)
MERRDSKQHLQDGEDSLEGTCDAALVLSDGTEVLVHSQALIMHSRFFRRMIADVQCGRPRAASGELLRIPLDDGTSLEDVEVLLGYLYKRDAVVNSFEDAKALVFLADKFDMPSIIRLCEPKLCSDVHRLHFAGFAASLPRGRSTGKSNTPFDLQGLDECYDAARWLSLAERWNLVNLMLKCQAVITQSLAYTDAKSTYSAFAKLQEHRISLKSMYSIASVLGQCLNNFGKCSCGKMFSSLRCSSCFLDNTPKATMDLCEKMLQECHKEVKGDEDKLRRMPSGQLSMSRAESTPNPTLR